jgi:hypothetical protein
MRKFVALLLVLVNFIIISGCQTLQIYGRKGLIIENRSSYDVRLESLKKILFTDRTTIPWKRSYRYYIHKVDAKTITHGQTRNVDIENGYYGIEICDGQTCTYTNFHFEKVIRLIIEDEKGKGRISYRFVE